MSRFLHRLRNKPEKTRHRIAVGTSAAVTGLVFVMWVTVLGYGGVMNSSTQEDVTVANQPSETASPLSSLRANAATAFTQLREGFRSAATTSDNISEEVSVEPEARSTTTEGRFNGEASSYWESRNNFPAATTVIDEPAREKSEGDIPFTSLEYDPSQEGEWLSQ